MLTRLGNSLSEQCMHCDTGACRRSVHVVQIIERRHLLFTWLHFSFPMRSHLSDFCGVIIIYCLG